MVKSNLSYPSYFFGGRQKVSKLLKAVWLFLFLFVFAITPLLAEAGAVRPSSDFTGLTSNVIDRSDDAYTSLINTGFSTNLGGTNSTNLSISINGFVTLGLVPDSTIVEIDTFVEKRGLLQIIAPFLADVDTTPLASGQVSYGTGTINSSATDSPGARTVFVVSWPDVGYYGSHTDKLNTFQLVLVSRDDVATGDFDIEFNYGTVTWESGDDNGTNGLGGDSVLVGYSAGTISTTYARPGSGIPGSFLDTNLTTGLVYGTQSATVSGRYIYQVRSGVVNVTDTTAPTVSSTNPANNATGVAIGSPINVVFSEFPDTGTINTNTISVSVDGGVTSLSGAVSQSGATAKFTPTNSLPYGTTITFYVRNDVQNIADISGNVLNPPGAGNYSTYNFTTVSAPPDDGGIYREKLEIVSFYPKGSNGKTGTKVCARLSMLINSNDINYVNGVDVGNFAPRKDEKFFVLKDSSGNSISGITKGHCRSVIFKPDYPLVVGEKYTATLKNTVRAANAAGTQMESDYSWTFTVADSYEGEGD